MLRNFLSNQPVSQLLQEPDTLAVLGFAGLGDDAIHSMQIGPLPASNAVEVWKVDGRVEQGKHRNCRWRRSDDLQFTSIVVPLGENDDYETAAENAYQEILSTINDSPLATPIRFWNYIPAINLGDGDLENYKQFCSGRLAAFTANAIQDSDFPAASAVGHHQSGLIVCALSGQTNATHHANPRQVDAFDYPREYGPASPSFARATTVQTDTQRLCFISGTASILGHNTVHQGDLRLQLYTTNDNILYLLEETGFEPSQIQTLRIYLRDRKQFNECREIVARSYPGAELIFSEADICRRELLVEIECFCVAT